MLPISPPCSLLLIDKVMHTSGIVLYFFTSQPLSSAGIGFTHGILMGSWASQSVWQQEIFYPGYYNLRNHEVLEVYPLWEHWMGRVGVQCHGSTLI